MRHHRLEIFVNKQTRELTCFICSPKFGQVADTIAGVPVQRCTLNDGQNRVSVCVFNSPLAIGQVQSLARIAVDQQYKQEQYYIRTANAR